MVPLPPRQTWLWLVERALEEDVGSGDVTAELLPRDLAGSARVEAREPIAVAGLPVAAEVFERLDLDFEALTEDGSAAQAGDVLALVRGAARGLVTAERTALNFLQRLSGIATVTRRFCDAVSGTAAQIVDTRKTAPGWRALDKYAVRCGGGRNHRMGLHDGVLLKDNHIAALGSVAAAVKRARERAPRALRVQVEVESPEAARAALDAGAELLLVDNQPPAVIAEIVALVCGRIPVEATGRVDLKNVAAIARTGVDRISVGALTHSAPAVDVALEWNAPSSS